MILCLYQFTKQIYLFFPSWIDQIVLKEEYSFVFGKHYLKIEYISNHVQNLLLLDEVFVDRIGVLLIFGNALRRIILAIIFYCHFLNKQYLRLVTLLLFIDCPHLLKVFAINLFYWAPVNSRSIYLVVMIEIALVQQMLRLQILDEVLERVSLLGGSIGWAELVDGEQFLFYVWWVVAKLIFWRLISFSCVFAIVGKAFYGWQNKYWRLAWSFALLLILYNWIRLAFNQTIKYL